MILRYLHQMLQSCSTQRNLFLEEMNICSCVIVLLKKNLKKKQAWACIIELQSPTTPQFWDYVLLPWWGGREGGISFQNLGEPKSLRDMRQTWILDIPQTPQQHKRILYDFFLKRNNCLLFYVIII